MIGGIKLNKVSQSTKQKPVLPDFTSPYQNAVARWLDKRFRITSRNSTILAELLGGLAVFLAMVYIIPVSSNMYAAVEEHPVMAAVAISLVTGLISITMGLLANVPIALSTGMGINAFVVYTICKGMGYSFNMVMICTAIEGFIFIVLSLTNARTALAKALPMNIKLFIGSGIGGFLLNIGAQNAKLIVNDDATLTTLVTFHENFSTQGITATLAIIALALMLILYMKDIKASVLIGMGVAWVLGMICQAFGWYVPDPNAGFYSLYPTWSLPNLNGVEHVFISGESLSSYGLSDWVNLFVITATMFYSDFFDTVGTAITCINGILQKMKEECATIKDAHKAELLQAEIDGLEHETTLKLVLLVDAIGTMIGAFFRITTVTSFVESKAGNGRTGLSSITTGVLFLLSIFCASIFTTVPSYATGAALIAVGCTMMLESLKAVDYGKDKMHQTIPGILCTLFMILGYSIADGMAFAIVFYAILSPFAVSEYDKDGNPKDKKQKAKEHVEKAGRSIIILTVLLLIKFMFL